MEAHTSQQRLYPCLSSCKELLLFWDYELWRYKQQACFGRLCESQTQTVQDNAGVEPKYITPLFFQSYRLRLSTPSQDHNRHPWRSSNPS